LVHGIRSPEKEPGERETEIRKTGDRTFSKEEIQEHAEKNREISRGKGGGDRECPQTSRGKHKNRQKVCTFLRRMKKENGMDRENSERGGGKGAPNCRSRRGGKTIVKKGQGEETRAKSSAKR